MCGCAGGCGVSVAGCMGVDERQAWILVFIRGRNMHCTTTWFVCEWLGGSAANLLIRLFVNWLADCLDG